MRRKQFSEDQIVRTLVAPICIISAISIKKDRRLPLCV
jgi:hypothetical protein